MMLPYPPVTERVRYMVKSEEGQPAEIAGTLNVSQGYSEDAGDIPFSSDKNVMAYKRVIGFETETGDGRFELEVAREQIDGKGPITGVEFLPMRYVAAYRILLEGSMASEVFPGARTVCVSYSEESDQPVTRISGSGKVVPRTIRLFVADSDEKQMNVQWSRDRLVALGECMIRVYKALGMGVQENEYAEESTYDTYCRDMSNAACHLVSLDRDIARRDGFYV